MQTDIIHPNFTICKEIPLRRKFHNPLLFANAFLLTLSAPSSQECEKMASDMAG